MTIVIWSPKLHAMEWIAFAKIKLGSYIQEHVNVAKHAEAKCNKKTYLEACVMVIVGYLCVYKYIYLDYEGLFLLIIVFEVPCTKGFS